MLARLTQPAGADIPQPSVNRPLVIQRQAAPEVATLDKSDREPARRRIVSSEQPVDAAANHKKVDASTGEVGHAQV
jgi:hypothetical protein